MLRTFVGLVIGFLCGCSITMGFIAPEMMIGSIVFSFISMALLFLWSASHHKRKQKEYYNRFKFKVINE